MTKGIGKIYVIKIQVLLAGLMILLHAIIPHHHHFDTPEAHLKHEECSKANAEKQSENADLHCHAFNVALVEKSRRHISKQSGIPQRNAVFLGDRTGEYPVLGLLIVTHTTGILIPGYSTFILEKNPLRGPPAMV